MVDAISSGFAGLKGAYELSKAFLDIRDAVQVQAKVFELQRLILDAQAAESALTEGKRQLEARVRELEAWEGEKQRYQLVSLAPGVVAFRLKPEAQGAEADHQLCADCFEQGHKRYLQIELQFPGRKQVAVCNGCKAVLSLHAPPPSSSTVPLVRG